MGRGPGKKIITAIYLSKGNILDDLLTRIPSGALSF